MSGNDDGDNNDQYEASSGQSPALTRSNKDQEASGSGSSPKKGAFDVRKQGRSKKKEKKALKETSSVLINLIFFCFRKSFT